MFRGGTLNFEVTGLPAVAIGIGFVIIFAAPVWLAARLVRAKAPTLLRSVAALFVGACGALLSLMIGGGWALFLGPIAFLVAFKYVVGTSYAGAIVLAVLAIAGYAAMLHFLGGGLHYGGIDA
jgi:hypothetical protein